MFLTSPEHETWHADVPKSSRKATAAGVALLAICSMGFGSWAAVAPLEGAVVASGRFVATGQNKQLQHLEGGIISEILVSEGEIVEAGQTLVRLDATDVGAKARRLEIRALRLAISRARLEAEIAGRDTFAIPASRKTALQSPEIEGILERQKVELIAGRKRLIAEEDVLKKEIAGLTQSILGYERQAEATQERLTYFQEELTAKQSLFDRALVRRSDLLQLKRAEASLHGEIGQVRSRIADSRERIARAEKQIVTLHSTAHQNAIEKLRSVETDLDDVEEQLRAARTALQRIEITAPVKGAIVKINRHTDGAVVAPGEVVLELLPLDAGLVIEARISPTEIAQVQVGQAANIRLSALNRRSTPIVSGKVTYLSADTIREGGSPARGGEGSGRESFVVRVQLDNSYRELIGHDFRPTPGMPADVYIKTEARTFFEYLMRPVFDSFSRAFREA
ncbi:MAG: HlyD family type I secretion periplasmic adaptor subunit [Hyphomicrobiaceae bacterium]